MSDPWDGVPFGPRPDLPGWEGGWAHPELLRRIEQLETAVLFHEGHINRGLLGPPPLELLRANGVTRYRHGDLEIELAPAGAMTKLTAWPYAGIPANVPAAPSVPANYGQRALEAANVLWSFLDDIDTADDRCKEDDAAFRRAALALAKRRKELAQSHDGHTLTWHWEREAAAEPVGKCLKSVAMGLCAREHGHPGPCSRGDAPPPPEAPDEQPAVEIDLAATEELLRAQDARRRGQGA